MRLKWEYMLTAVFLTFAVIFLLLIALEINLGKNYRAQKLEELRNIPSAGFNMEEIPTYHFNYKAIGDYTDIVQRPLFFKSREPIIIEELEGEPAKEAGTKIEVLEDIGIDLVGIIKTPEGEFALFQNPKAKSHAEKFQRLAQGGEINGWELKKIQNDRVIIVGNGEEKVLLLSKPHPRMPAKKTKRRIVNPFQRQTKK